MASPSPKDLLIECKGCKIENLFSGYTPDQFAVCNQCREGLIRSDLEDTHSEYICRDCRLVLVLLNETEITTGESTCRCGGNQILKVNQPTIQSEAAAAGLFDDVEPGDNPDEDFDWCRSGPDANIAGDYNDMFDQDPSQ